MFELICYINFICIFIALSNIKKSIHTLDEKIDSLRRIYGFNDVEKNFNSANEVTQIENFDNDEDNLNE